MKNVVLAIALVVSVISCGAAQECKEPANMNSAKCTAINSTIDCTKGELPAVVSQFGPVVSQLINEATGADGSVDWAHVEKILGSLGAAYGSCVIGSIIENYMTAPPKLSPGEVAPDLNVLKAGFAHAKTTMWKLPADTKVHTAKGDL